MSGILKDRVAFVTGGTGAIGQALVRVFSREGARVAYSYHEQAGRAVELDGELARSGFEVHSYPLDVLDGPGATALAERVEAEVGPVSVLVNNAGVTQVMPFALIEEEDWDRVLDVNVKGLFLVTKAFIRGMIRRRQGSIVNLGSLAGTRVLDVPVHYATAKSAVLGFTLSLAKEMSRYKIRVNAVIPGLLTEGVSANVPEREREEYLRYCTLSRAGRPEEVAELVAFLASDRSSYINAQAIAIDGGI
jgi:NAD(P)-dependent dehydrogenase (short-subunit alcohol dehydrogenase family)